MNAKLARRFIAPVVAVPAVRPPARVVVQLLENGSPHGLDPALGPTDRVLERWAASQGS